MAPHDLPSQLARSPPPQRPQLDPGRLLQDGAGGEALDLGEQAADAGAAVGAGQVEALEDGEEAGGRVFGRHGWGSLAGWM